MAAERVQARGADRAVRLAVRTEKVAHSLTTAEVVIKAVPFGVRVRWISATGFLGVKDEDQGEVHVDMGEHSVLEDFRSQKSIVIAFTRPNRAPFASLSFSILIISAEPSAA